MQPNANFVKAQRPLNCGETSSKPLSNLLLHHADIEREYASDSAPLTQANRWLPGAYGKTETSPLCSPQKRMLGIERSER
jgi:hypothetical protein